MVIQNNSVEVFNGKAAREAHGIYVGHFRSLILEDNEIVLMPRVGSKEELIEGIRIYGYRGPLMLVRQNIVQGFLTGAFIGPQLGSGVTGHWDIAHNGMDVLDSATILEDSRIDNVDHPKLSGP